MQRLVLLSAVMFGATACVIGGNVKTYPPAQWPQGVHVEIGTSRSRVAGGLLNVDSTGLLVLADSNRLLRVPLAETRLVEPEQGQPVWVHLPEQKALRDLREVRLMSRFPQGVSSDLLQKLLEAYGQDSVVVVRR